METYITTSATLSLDNIETTDNLIASAIKTIPKSAVASIMPVVKTKGPTSQWVEPWFNEDKLELVSTPVSVFEKQNERRNIRFSSNALEDICRIYTPEAFTSLVHSWVLFQKNKKQRDELVQLLESPEVKGVTPEASIPSLRDPLSQDDSKIIQTRVIQAINDIQKDFQLGEVHFSIAAPYEMGYALSLLKLTFKEKIHIFYDERLTKVYIFPTGDSDMSRAGLSVFEYSDEIQKSIDPETGDLAYWVYSRSKIAINPIHQKHPIIRNLELK